MQEAPVALQRSHWRARTSGSLPAHVPVVEPKSSPSRGSAAASSGAPRLTGTPPVTVAVAGDCAVVVPAAFVAETATRSVVVTSAAVTRYVLAVAPPIGLQTPAVQRCQA